MHELALEGCFECVQHNLNALKNIEDRIAALKRRTRKLMRRKKSMNDRLTVAREGKEKEREQWRELGNPIAISLLSAEQRLRWQLEATGVHYQDLEQEFRQKWADVVENTAKVKEAKVATKSQSVIRAWQSICSKTGALLRSGEMLLPELESEMEVFRNEILSLRVVASPSA